MLPKISSAHQQLISICGSLLDYAKRVIPIILEDQVNKKFARKDKYYTEGGSLLLTDRFRITQQRYSSKSCWAKNTVFLCHRPMVRGKTITAILQFSVKGQTRVQKKKTKR